MVQLLSTALRGKKQKSFAERAKYAVDSRPLPSVMTINQE